LESGTGDGGKERFLGEKRLLDKSKAKGEGELFRSGNYFPRIVI